MSGPTAPLLEAAIASLRSSTDTLASALSTLGAGVADLPRLARVLAQTRHFELVPASGLAAAQAAVLAELAPEVEALVARVEQHVERLERREQSLRARWELQEGRLGREAAVGAAEPTPSSADSIASSQTHKGGSRSAAAAAGPMQELRATQLRQKKERLSYAVERLNMQAQQTQRKLRMSIAAQGSRSAARSDDDDDGSMDELSG